MSSAIWWLFRILQGIGRKDKRTEETSGKKKVLYYMNSPLESVWPQSKLKSSPTPTPTVYNELIKCKLDSALKETTSEHIPYKSLGNAHIL